MTSVAGKYCHEAMDGTQSTVSRHGTVMMPTTICQHTPFVKHIHLYYIYIMNYTA